MSGLNGFLDEGLPANDPAADPAPPVDAPAVVDGAAAGAAPVDPQPEAKAAEPPVAEEEEPSDQKGLLAALHATRKLRNDHKGRADTLEGQVSELRKQLDDALRAPPAPPPAPVVVPEPVAIPNPVEDPQGYHEYRERLALSRHLDSSEMLLRDRIGDDNDVDAKIAVFKKAADANPALGAELARQKNPYRWVYETAQKIMAMEEIGSDPAAYRAKVESELRAKLAAEAAAGNDQRQALAAVVLPTSLGTARSAAPRLPAVVEPMPFEQIFGRQKKA